LFSDARIASLEELLTSNLKRYIANFGMPDGLFLVRDGLSFYQEQKFLLAPNGELDIIRNVLKNLGLTNWTLIMEKKSTHLRMYKKLGGIKVDNPDPGTVIIGFPFESNEMLMVCQQTYQGTVSPIFYKVIHPENVNMEEVANAINKLCRHHWNTNKAIKIPAPAQHADRITYLVRRILGTTPKNRDLLDKPFYL
jgi:argonaute-like protein implicated in RNA metabolism and viral defense